MKVGVVERIEQQPGDDLRTVEGPATQRQNRRAVQRARSGQYQPGGLKIGGQAVDYQANAQGHGEDEHQVQYVEMPSLAGEQQHNRQDREYPEKQHRQPGKTLVTDEADNQIEEHPDNDAGDINQQAEFMQPLEFMLDEFSLECRRRGFFQDFIFNGFVHRRPIACAGCRVSPCPTVDNAGKTPPSDGNLPRKRPGWPALRGTVGLRR
ncbi:hypothetical protein D3C84_547580 [compost metagenome]